MSNMTFDNITNITSSFKKYFDNPNLPSVYQNNAFSGTSLNSLSSEVSYTAKDISNDTIDFQL